MPVNLISKTKKLIIFSLLLLLGSSTYSLGNFTERENSLRYAQLSAIDTVSDQSVEAGEATADIIFSSSLGTAVFNWINDSPSIGLPSKGTGNIPSFISLNTGITPITARVVATPVSTSFAYVPNSANQVSVINNTTRKQVELISVGASPYGVAVSPNGSMVYISNSASGNVSVIRTATNKVVATVTVGTAPKGIAISPDGSRVYVANSGSNTVSVINTSTNVVIATVPVDALPNCIAVSPDGMRVYITAQNGVSVIDTSLNSQIVLIPIGSTNTKLSGIAISPDGLKVYAARGGSSDNSVAIINTNTNTVSATVSVGSNPSGVAINPEGDKIFVSNTDSESISVIGYSTNAVIATITLPAGSVPHGIAISSTGDDVQVVNKVTGFLMTIDARTYKIKYAVAVGSLPTSLGKFITDGNGVIGDPTSFTITVNPYPPAITSSIATGTISECEGSNSPSSNALQFRVSGTYLTSPITVTSPKGFEISTIQEGGYSNLVTLTPLGFTVSPTIIYVRSVLSNAGLINNYITVSSDGVAPQNVAVKATIYALPKLDALPDYSFSNGEATPVITLKGTGNAYSWVNSNTSIGLDANGAGDIKSFITNNTGGIPVSATIDVTSYTGALAYIANRDSDNISVVSTNTNKVITTIPLKPQSAPYAVCVSPDDSRVYVTNLDGSLTIISTKTNRIIDIVPVDAKPIGIATNLDGSKLYIIHSDDGMVSIINATTLTLIKEIFIGTRPHSIAVSPDGASIYVSTSVGLSVIDDATNMADVIISNIDVTGLVVSPDGKRLYATDLEKIFVIDTETNTIIHTITINAIQFIEALTVSPDGNRLFVAVSYGNSEPAGIQVINTNTFSVISKFPVTVYPYRILLNSNGDLLYTIGFNDKIGVINTVTNLEVAIVTVGSHPVGEGNFITHGTNCNGDSKSFGITITPVTLISTPIKGSINACAGTASASPNLIQFNVSGSKINSSVKAVSPNGFEISLTVDSGYTDTINLSATDGVLPNTTIYVRSAANAPLGVIYGNISLTSTDATPHYIKVTARITSTSTIEPVDDRIIKGGTLTTPINFKGTGIGTAYVWTNDNPSIGLPASGIGNIPAFAPINGGGENIIATINATPVAAGFAYIPSADADLVWVINVYSNTPLTKIKVGDYPYGVSVSADGKYVYITNFGSDNVSVIDANTNTVVATIPVADEPKGIVVSPDGTRVYVSHTKLNSVSVINTITKAVMATIKVDDSGFTNGIAISPDGKRVYVSNKVIDTDTNAVVGIFGNLESSGGICFNPEGDRAYVAHSSGSEISVINTATNTLLTRILYAGVAPKGIVTSPDGSKIYVANSEENNKSASSVSIIDARTYNVIDRVYFFSGESSWLNGISINAAGTKLYIPTKSGTLYVLDTQTNKVSTTLKIDSSPYALGNFIVSGAGCNGVSVAFKLTVKPGPDIVCSKVASGSINACVGTASQSPQLQQITASGSNLTSPIVITAPSNFEVSTNINNGYNNSILLDPINGIVPNTIVYIRSSASMPVGYNYGQLTLATTDSQTKSLFVSCIVMPIPTLTPGNLTATVGLSYKKQIAGVPEGYDYTFSATGLPSGLSISPTGLISGIPTTATVSPALVTISVNGPCPQSADYKFKVKKGTATLSLSDMTHTYDGTEKAVTVTTSPVGLPTTVTYNGASYLPKDAGTYTISATVNSSDYNSEIITGVLTINKAEATIVVGNLLQTYDGNEKTVTITTVPDGLPTILTYNGEATLPKNAGNYAIEATINALNYEGHTNETLIVNKAIASISIENKTHTYDGTNKSVSISTVPSNLESSVTYNGNASLPIQAGTYDLFVMINDANYSGSVSDQFIIGKLPLIIGAENLTKRYGENNPSLTLYYSGFIVGESADVINSMPVISTTASKSTKPGIYAIELLGGFDDNYDLILKNGSLTIQKADQIIDFSAIGNQLSNAPPIILHASSSSELPVSFMVISGPVTLSKNTLTITGGGDAVVRAIQEGNENFLPASSIDQAFTIDVVSAIEPTSSQTDIHIFPIPTTDLLYVTFPLSCEAGSLALIDVTGRIVLNKRAALPTTELNVTNISKGLYLLRVTYDDFEITRHVVIH